MDFVLDAAEVRVIGALVEKEITTPEYYPLTMNALVNACNQKSNRDPVVAYDEDIVAEAVDSLHDKRLLGVLSGGSNRVPKYSHRLGDRLNLGRREMALICELLVRGPQTVGELRDRASRMHRFSDIDEVEACLRALAEFSEGPLVTQLPRQAGRKEARYAHLLAGEIVEAAAASPAPVADGPRSGLEARVTLLEAELRQMKSQMDRLMSELGLH